MAINIEQKKSRIKEAFQNGKAFISFVTGGDPSLEKTAEFVIAMQEAGADLIEIGVPFSDPIAEGPVIQDANLRALAAGTTLDDLFDLVQKLRAGEATYGAEVAADTATAIDVNDTTITGSTKLTVPVVFLTYLNPVFHYGYERFCSRAEEVGLDGIIIPDMPFEEQGELKPIVQAHGIDLISLIAPTSKERTLNIAREATGFIYVVSSMGVTGVRAEVGADIEPAIQQIKSVTDVPAAVGFGIHTPDQAAAIAKYADGVIVGSRIVKIVAEQGENAAPHIAAYVREMKSAIRTNEKQR
jgi:tryptophan synthase alpha chain